MSSAPRQLYDFHCHSCSCWRTINWEICLLLGWSACVPVRGVKPHSDFFSSSGMQTQSILRNAHCVSFAIAILMTMIRRMLLFLSVSLRSESASALHLGGSMVVFIEETEQDQIKMSCCCCCCWFYSHSQSWQCGLWHWIVGCALLMLHEIFCHDHEIYTRGILPIPTLNQYDDIDLSLDKLEQY